MAARRRDEMAGAVDAEELLREALNAVAFAVLVFDERGYYTYAFSSHDDEMVIPSRELIGKSVRDVLPASRAAEVEQLIRTTIETGEEQTTDFAVEGASSVRIHLAASFRLLHSASSPRVLVTLRDQTEHEALARKLRELERRYRALLDNAPDAIFVMDVTSGRFTEVNDRAVALFGVDRARLLTMAIADVSAPSQPDGRSGTEAIGERLAQALAGDQPVFEWVVRDASGRNLTCELRLERVPLADRVAVRGSAVDITEHKMWSRKVEACRERCRELASVELRAVIDELVEVSEQAATAAERKRLVALARAVEGAVEAMLAEIGAIVVDD